MNYEKIKESALACGFTAAEIISIDELVFRPEFRKYCEENDCGNYGKNYACPPACGTTLEMEQRVRKYQHALVLQTRFKVSDLFDGAQIKPLKKRHTQMTLQIVKSGTIPGLPDQGLFIMAGPCNFCDICKLQDGAPCAHEELRFSCLSAYCIDVTKLAETCHMEISWDGNIVSFFSLYCF